MEHIVVPKQLYSVYIRLSRRLETQPGQSHPILGTEAGSRIRMAQLTIPQIIDVLYKLIKKLDAIALKTILTARSTARLRHGLQVAKPDRVRSHRLSRC